MINTKGGTSLYIDWEEEQKWETKKRKPTKNKQQTNSFLIGGTWEEHYVDQEWWRSVIVN